jgi:choline dehydrogenase-like flavoprotein
MEVGSLMESPTHIKTEQNSTGSAPACSEDARTTGDRISLRFGPKDFKHKSIDGLGDDWPIGYEDVAPYYDKVDKLIGVFGSTENLPNDPDGIFLPPPKPRLHELFIKEAGTSIGMYR